jgi:hypothetical protein
MIISRSFWIAASVSGAPTGASPLGRGLREV